MPEAPPPAADMLAFTPAPTNGRHDGWTPERQRAFIDQLARIGVVTAAARAVGMSAKSAYLLRRRADAADFAAAWDAAQAEGRRHALSLAIERALHGTATPVFYRGRRIGERRTYHNRLLITAIQAIDPAERGHG